jgi:hypothetical protein
MRSIFIAISAVLTIGSIAPYISDVITKKTRPRIVSWFNWSLLTGIASAAAISDKQYPSAVLTLAATLATVTVVIFGLRNGDKKFEPFDIICQVGAILGLIFWLVFNSPLVAILSTVSIDFIAALPTIKHAWLKPGEETSITFVISTIGSAFSLLALNKPDLLGVVYPIYLLLCNGLVSAILLSGPYRFRTLSVRSKSQS